MRSEHSLNVLSMETKYLSNAQSFKKQSNLEKRYQNMARESREKRSGKKPQTIDSSSLYASNNFEQSGP